MFTLQVGFMSPSFVGIVPSIEMVIYCAVGGRLSILGAVYGSLLVNYAKTSFSEFFPELWLFAMGALFIGVVLAFPNGLAGLYQQYVMPWLPGILTGRTKERSANKMQSNSLSPAQSSDNTPAMQGISKADEPHQQNQEPTTTSKNSAKLNGGEYAR